MKGSISVVSGGGRHHKKTIPLTNKVVKRDPNGADCTSSGFFDMSLKTPMDAESMGLLGTQLLN